MFTESDFGVFDRLIKTECQLYFGPAECLDITMFGGFNPLRQFGVCRKLVFLFEGLDARSWQWGQFMPQSNTITCSDPVAYRDGSDRKVCGKGALIFQRAVLSGLLRTDAGSHGSFSSHVIGGDPLQ